MDAVENLKIDLHFFNIHQVFLELLIREMGECVARMRDLMNTVNMPITEGQGT
jgi:hypothetical protein